MRDEERLAQMEQKALWTSRNQGVNVKVNKLDFLWLLERAKDGLSRSSEPPRNSGEATGADGLIALGQEDAPTE